MQLAARKVAWENTQLRDLLTRNGISPEEIEEFLRNRERVALRVPLNTVAKEVVQSSITAQVQEDRPIEALRVASPTDQILRETSGQGIGSGDQGDGRSSGEVEAHVVAETLVGELNEGVSQLSSRPQETRRVDPVRVPNSAKDKCGCHASCQPPTVDGQNNMLPTVSDCFRPAPPTSSSFTGDNSMLEMSCETAASIILDMHGNGDREQARSQLGCEGRRHCNVKNINVLEIIEMV